MGSLEERAAGLVRAALDGDPAAALVLFDFTAEAGRPVSFSGVAHLLTEPGPEVIRWGAENGARVVCWEDGPSITFLSDTSPGLVFLPDRRRWFRIRRGEDATLVSNAATPVTEEEYRLLHLQAMGEALGLSENEALGGARWMLAAAEDGRWNDTDTFTFRDRYQQPPSLRKRIEDAGEAVTGNDYRYLAFTAGASAIALATRPCDGGHFAYARERVNHWEGDLAAYDNVFTRRRLRDAEPEENAGA